jgi:mono/diheme cytochrome c family protein
MSMAKMSMWAVAAAPLLPVLLGGCSVEIQNTQPAQAVARQAQPAGSVAVGWRVFQQRCASCHGPAAMGGSGIPNLLPLVREMGPRQFVSQVLYRYDWGIAPEIAKGASAGRADLVESIVQRREGQITMPAWQGEPVVTAQIMDLYAYLSARADGSQGPEQPGK